MQPAAASGGRLHPKARGGTDLYAWRLVTRTGRTLGALLALVALVLGLVAPLDAAAASEGPRLPPVPAHAEVDPSSVIVRFADHTGPAARSALLARHGLGAGARAIGPSPFVEVRTRGRSRAELGRRLRDEPAVTSIEPNLVQRAFAAPNDPLYTVQREYLDLVRIEGAWAKVDPLALPLTAPLVAVIDSGVNPTHEDLIGRVRPGRDFVDDDLDADDQLGHGTLVAGVLAASTNNARGIAGAAWNAQILPVRVLNAEGQGNDASVAAGIHWAIDSGAQVLNLSLGGYGAGSATGNAIARAVTEGRVVIASAGNLIEGAALFKVPVYPAAFPGVVAVSATEDAGHSVRFSLFGSWVDLAAPGYAVLGTTKEGTYAAASGTSFAAPLVSGVAAILRGRDASMTAAQISTTLVSTARDAGPPGRDDVYGAGILDATAAVGEGGAAALPPAAGDAFEPNDTVGTATLMGASVSATIAPEGEIDHYRISVPSPSRVTVVVEPPPAVGVTHALDPILRLRTLGGTLLRSRDVNGTDVAETLTYDTSGGTFVVEVENFLPTLSPGPYSLRVSTEALATGATATTTSTTAPATTTTTAAPPPTTAPPVAVAPSVRRRSGYWMVGKDGAVYGFGDARNLGRVVGMTGGIEAVDLEPTPSLSGYWIVTNSGHVHAIGDAPYLGGLDGALAFGEAVTSISRTAGGRGYWLFTTKGRVVPFGDAPHLGDMSGVRLNGPVLDSIPSPSGAGYYMVASDGGIFTFGDAAFQGSMGGIPLNAPVQSLVPDADGSGYWLVASDGGIFSFDAPFRGSMGGTRLNGPITGMVRFGDGYLMVGTDGGIFTFTDEEFFGSLGANPPPSPIVSVAAAEG